MKDLRFAMRQMRKSPGFTLVAVITRAIGIGMNTAIFSLMNELFLQGLPYEDSGRIVVVQAEAKERNLEQLPMSVPRFWTYRDGQTVFTQFAVDTGNAYTVTGFGDPIGGTMYWGASVEAQAPFSFLPKEAGLRAILNFGQTFGHAIEAGMGYGVWLHGEGVAAGMVMAGELSHRLGLVDAAFVRRLVRLIGRAGLPTQGPVLDAADNAGRYLELMRDDKKSEAGEIRFVVIDSPGSATVRSAPERVVREVIDACCK